MHEIISGGCVLGSIELQFFLFVDETREQVVIAAELGVVDLLIEEVFHELVVLVHHLGVLGLVFFGLRNEESVLRRHISFLMGAGIGVRLVKHLTLGDVEDLAFLGLIEEHAILVVALPVGFANFGFRLNTGATREFVRLLYVVPVGYD